LRDSFAVIYKIPEAKHTYAASVAVAMLITKLCLLGTILSTWYTAQQDGSLPYFPIEISRTATGTRSKKIFCWGVTACTLAMYMESDSAVNYITWAGLLVLAWIDDVTSLAGHNAGVVIMSFGAFLRSVTHPEASFLLFLAACVIYAPRRLAKVSVVASQELQRPLDADTLLGLVFDIDGFRTKLLKTTMNIMYKGPGEIKQPFTTLAVFKFCGVLQWVVFFLFSTLY